MKSSGNYFIDPTGNYDNTKTTEVSCDEEGWTNVLVHVNLNTYELYNKLFVEYEEGFGGFGASYTNSFIGLKHLYE